MANFFKKKATILALLAFVAIVALSLGPWWENLMEGVKPDVPNVSAIYLGTSPPSGKWQFVIEDKLIDNCAIAYVYNFTPPNVLTVYEIDAGTLQALGISKNKISCTGGMEYGYLAVNFTKRPDTLSIHVWTSRSTEIGSAVYFVELGSWRFVNGSYIGYMEPSLSKNYMLQSFEDVMRMVNETGIHYINR